MKNLSKMHRRILLVLILGAVWLVNEYNDGRLFNNPTVKAMLDSQSQQSNNTSSSSANTSSVTVSLQGQAQVDQAFAQQRSDLIVTLDAEVIKVLPDDNKGSRHQRFLLKLDSGLTVLVAHNIDLAPRVADLSRGDVIRIKGEYEWTDKGGVIHWTHHDPAGRHVGGWIERNGQRYE